MSQKSSIPQVARFVSQALMSDRVAHFFVLYGAATLDCLDNVEHHSTVFFVFALASTLIAGLAVVGIALWQAARMRRWNNTTAPADGTHFLRLMSLLMALAALLAIVWGALPVAILSSCGETAL